MKGFKIFSLCFSLCFCWGKSQQDSLLVNMPETSEITSKNLIKEENSPLFSKNYTEIFSPDPISAMKKSAIVPGWGQYYNQEKWKIPVVWVAIGASVGYLIWSQKEYKRYRVAFEAQLQGKPHEFSSVASYDLARVLGRTQEAKKRQRDYAIVTILGVYLLNILDAYVDAHLYEAKRDKDLSLRPAIWLEENTSHSMAKFGVKMEYVF